MECQFCKSDCKKDGKQKDGTQKYRCRSCKRYQQKEYRYLAKLVDKRRMVARLVVNNCGFRGTSRALEIAVNTVMKLFYKAVSKLQEPRIAPGGVFEIDEMKAHGKKGKVSTWVCYGIERKSKSVIGISVCLCI